MFLAIGCLSAAKGGGRGAVHRLSDGEGGGQQWGGGATARWGAGAIGGGGGVNSGEVVNLKKPPSQHKHKSPKQFELK